MDLDFWDCFGRKNKSVLKSKKYGMICIHNATYLCPNKWGVCYKLCIHFFVRTLLFKTNNVVSIGDVTFSIFMLETAMFLLNNENPGPSCSKLH